MLVIMGGLPATGKTTVSRALARQIGAVHLRIDTIEQAVVEAGAGVHPLGPVGYAVGYALAGDFLRQGLAVVADSVNPVAASRDGWRAVPTGAGTGFVEVELVCSDPAEHRRRAACRVAEIPGLPLPGWADIVGREYEGWGRDRLIVDTAGCEVADCVRAVVDRISGRARHS